MKSLAEALGLDETTLTMREDLSDSQFEGMTGREFARVICDSADFRRYILGGLRAGDLPSAVAIRLMDHAWGKPVDRVEHSGVNGQPIITRVERVIVHPGASKVDELEAEYGDRSTRTNTTH